MITRIDFDRITELFDHAMAEGRQSLYEYETYQILQNSGAETPPKTQLLLKGTRPSDEELTVLPGDQVVMKIVSPTIVHKTEVGGVRVIEKRPERIRSARRRMMIEVAENYARWIELHPGQAPESYRGLEGEGLIDAISKDILGVLLCQFMPPDSQALGNELIVGIRYTREFGMIVSAGLGGTDTELYAQRFQKGQAVIAASTQMTDGETFFQLFKKTFAYTKLAGLTRARKRIVTDEQLLECFSSFIEMANYYSPANPAAPYVIEELEINPFAFTDYMMVPLDGMCRFSKPIPGRASRPIGKIDRLLHPKSIGIIGVSATRANFGRLILQNMLSAGYEKSGIVAIHPSEQEIEGVRCVPDLPSLPQKLDLFIVAVAAEQVPALVDEILELDAAESVMLIPGGLGEKQGSEDTAQTLQEKINASHQRGNGGPVFLGSNCMGIISRPACLDTIFIPREKLPTRCSKGGDRVAIISQSGAFMITRLSKLSLIDPAYMISIGNQTDLTVGDVVTYLKGIPDLNAIAIYVEGFKDMDGLSLCRAVREAVLKGKDVIFYKAGRTPEGKSATSGHTASLAGDYMVCESCLTDAGAMVAGSFTQFDDLFLLSSLLHGKEINGNRLAAVSGAGFEAVGMADAICGEDFQMKMASFGADTVSALESILRDFRLNLLVDVKNPLDINPGANDLAHVRVVETLIRDAGIDGVVVGLDPLSPVTKTLPPGAENSLDHPSSIARLLPELAARSRKPIVGVVDGGKLYDPLVEALEAAGLPVFRSSDRAVAALGKYIEGRLRAARIRNRGQLNA